MSDTTQQVVNSQDTMTTGDAKPPDSGDAMRSYPGRIVDDLPSAAFATIIVVWVITTIIWSAWVITSLIW